MNHRTTDPLLTVRDVAHLLNVSPRTVWRLVSTGDLPRPIRLGPRTCRWRPADVARLVDESSQNRKGCRYEQKQ